MTALPDFRLETHFSRWEFAARYHLTASDAESMSMAELLDWADDEDREAWSTLRLGYTQTHGDPRLRELIASTYDGVAPEQILCFAGAEEGLYLAMQVLLARGDHAVVVTPNYQAAETVPLSQCEVTGVALEADRDFALDIARIEAALLPNTKLVSVNFPNNPTGKVIPKADFERLAALCDARDIHLFSDEVYRGLERDPSRMLPQAADLSPRALSLNVLSKALGLPGLRIGWIACRDRTVISRLERAKHYTSICNAAPSEILARIALKSREKILKRNRAIVAENLPRFEAFFARYPSLFEWAPPDGGCVGFPRYLGNDGVEAFCEALVEEAGVLLLPSSIYRSELTPTPSDRFRIGVGRRGAEEALEAFGQWLQKRPANSTHI
ncbi:pyridoxal phosphate-dependent aminotransferase [Pendulispora rubella]|uniref:Pyridoxal phosphate-dependent aminotransferase n=1 Tax=Pendulispora rubella TaxID=2741070 RepID=A0ABZ2L2P8_9BACT